MQTLNGIRACRFARSRLCHSVSTRVVGGSIYDSRHSLPVRPFRISPPLSATGVLSQKMRRALSTHEPQRAVVQFFEVTRPTWRILDVALLAMRMMSVGTSDEKGSPRRLCEPWPNEPRVGDCEASRDGGALERHEGAWEGPRPSTRLLPDVAISEVGTRV